MLLFCYTQNKAQSAGWMMGTWNSLGQGNITNTIRIKDASGESFSGTKTSTINDAAHTKIVRTISGSFKARLYIQNGEVIRRQPQNAQWNDCSSCAQANKVVVHRDSILLITTITNCDSSCDGETVYYRLFTEYDEATQKYIVNRFGRPGDILAFQPYQQQKNNAVEDDDTADVTENTDGLNNISQQQKIRDQAIADSLNLVQQQAEQRIKDSLDAVARLRQQQIDDSTQLAQQKIREQAIADSLNHVQQQAEQRIKDSLDAVARLRQQQIDDSTQLAQQKIREQAIADSLNHVQQQAEQHIKDSLDAVARLRQQQIDDSTQLAQQRIREQAITDSLNLVQQKAEQRIKDSLDAVARLRQQQIDDSTQLAQQKIRDQAIADSLNLVQQKAEQRIKDSLQTVAEALANAAPLSDSSKTEEKELTTRTSVLLGSYHINTPDILIELFDNGEIDGDRVSVYHNNAIIVSNQTLGTKPITLNIHADATHREHEFMLVAENLGSIPPNSALMRITAGKERYNLYVKTDMATNARVVFYYDGN